jgi:serralysin
VDRFIFSTASDAGNGAEMDTIRDFVTGSDKVDLSMIDANAAVTGNQSFSAALVTGFTGLAGQLMTARSGSDLIVSGDLNGDRVADFQIRLSDVSAITAGDFIL